MMNCLNLLDIPEKNRYNTLAGEKPADNQISPYQERLRDRPDEARQPAQKREVPIPAAG